jgi:ATP-dependent DNA ligase
MWGKFKRGCKIDQENTGTIDLDLVVMGVIYGEGKRNPFFATFLLGAYQG